MVESIANGMFDIYSLPKLHREEHLRFRHTTKSTEGLFMAINGTQFEHVIGRTRMESAFPQITSFLTAWQVYTAVRISFNNERAASINYWTERIIVRANNHPWLSVLNYAVAFFQKYQNAPPDAWFNTDLELIADHLITPSHPKAANNPGTSYKASPKKSDNPFHSNICQNWNHPKRGCSTKERSGIECTRLHVCYTCRKVTTKLINALNSQLPVRQVDPLGPTLRSHHEQI